MKWVVQKVEKMTFLTVLLTVGKWDLQMADHSVDETAVRMVGTTASMMVEKLVD